MLLEADQPGLVQIGSPQIEMHQTFFLGVLDCLPEEKRHDAKRMKPGVGGTVFVDQDIPVPQRDDSGNRLIFDPCQTEEDPIPQAGCQVGKPFDGLRRQAMPSSGSLLQVVKRFDFDPGAAFAIPDPIPFRPSDFSLHAILMESSPNLIDRWRQVQSVKKESIRFPEYLAGWTGIERPQLDILPASLIPF